jgi:DNA (cytosine-5)-methyltransferase 1
LTSVTIWAIDGSQTHFREVSDVDTRTCNVLSICSGVGGIELGLHAALAGRTRTVCYVENELGVGSILAARMEDGSLDPAPIWDDLRTFDPEPWSGRVDILAGGFPCQPHSVAGSQLGEDDPRELSGEVLRIAAGLGYPTLFLENVPGILRFYWDSIRPELREMGYEIEEGLFTASETGAPHRRERLFILAHAEGSGGSHGIAKTERQGRSPSSGVDNKLAHAESIGSERPIRGRVASRESQATAGDRGNELADPDGIGSTQNARDYGKERSVSEAECQPKHGAIISRGSRTELADTYDEGLQRRDECGDSARERATGTSSPELGELPLYPPGPNDHEGWAYLLNVMPEVEPTFCRDADGAPAGVDRRLRAVGNGVVPAVAALAFRELARQRSVKEEDTA